MSDTFDTFSDAELIRQQPKLIFLDDQDCGVAPVFKSTNNSPTTFSAKDKADLIIRCLKCPEQTNELCREAGISSETFTTWRDVFLKGGERELGKEPDDASSFGELSDDFYRRIVHSFPGNMLIARIDDGAILFRAKSTQATYGIRDQTSEHWANQDEREVFVEQMKTHGRVDNMPFTGRKHDGSEFPCQLSSQLIEYNGQSISITTSTDLTRFHAMREEIERANELLRVAIEAFDEGIMLYSADLRLELFNQRANDLFYGKRGGFEIGKTFAQVCQDFADSGRIQMPEGLEVEDWARFSEEDIKNYVVDRELILTDGRILLGTSHRTSRDGYLLTVRDVTDQRRAEKAERDADRLLRVIVEACPTTFLVSRVDNGEIIYFPPASREQFGDIESTQQFFLDPSDRIEFLNTLIPSGAVDDYPVRFRRRDGSKMDGLTSARIASYNGEDVIVSSTRDISEQLAMQAQLDHQKEIAHQNEKLSALGELLAGVAHELNNPLSIVVGYALMLQGKIDDPVVEKRIHRIGQAAERCAKIVKMFLAMARQRPAEIERCDLNPLIESTMDVAGYSFRSSGGTIKLELAKSLPAVAADQDQLAQVITNLVINAEHALKDSKRQRKIKIKTLYEKASQMVAIKVRDNGNGIPKKIQSRVFEPFFTTKDVGVGTGVGLAFCHRTIQAHDGTLSLYSQLGQGTTFIVRLPVTHEAVSLIDDENARRRNNANHSILIVDDEHEVAELICDILEESGYDVRIENDPRAAKKLLDQHNFDAVLSDMRMPNMNGEQFYSSIKDHHPSIAEKFALVTGDIMRSEVSDFLEVSGIPYLEKPVAPDELLNLAADLCSRRKEKPQ